MLSKLFNKRGAQYLIIALGKKNPMSYATWRSVENTDQFFRT